MMKTLLACGALALCWSAADVASAQSRLRPERYAIDNVRLSPTDDAEVHRIVVRNGRIEAIHKSGDAVPEGAAVIDGKGRLAVPALIDAYTRTGCPETKPRVDQDHPVDVSSDVRVDMRDANRKGIQPAFVVADGLDLTKEATDAWRKSGFGAALIVPGGELLAGTSALVTTRDAAARDAVVRPIVFAHAAFRASGDGYPSTLMGYHAQLRQYFLDARHHEELRRRYDNGAADPRPPYDPTLAAAAPILSRQRTVVCEANGARDIERWLRLSNELGFDLAIAGGREAWKLADRLRERHVPLFLTLDWGEEVKDPDAKKGGGRRDAGDEPEDKPGSRRPIRGPREDEEPGGDADKAASGDAPEAASESYEYEEPLDVRRHRRHEWEQGRDAAIRLHEAGVPFAFGSGDAKPADLLKRVRQVCEAGLPRDVAIDALTRAAADAVGAGRRLGRLEPGFDATFALWTDHPMESDAQVAWVFVDGEPYELEVKPKRERKATKSTGAPAEGVDVSGRWKLTYRRPDSDEDSEAWVDLTMEEGGAVSGTFETNNPMTAEPMSSPASGQLDGSQLSVSTSLDFGGFALDVELVATVTGDELSGDLNFSGEFGERSAKVNGERDPLSDGDGEEDLR